MDELVIAFDVGGTNTRARVAVVAGGGEPRLAIPDVTIRVASAHELHEFVSQVARSAEHLGTVKAAVVAVAGPVVGAQSRVTNWASDSAVVASDLVRAGLPLGHTRLINDAVAGAWGALARVESGAAAGRTEILTARGDGEPELGAGSLVYVAPGTGLGVAILVRHGLGLLGATVVGCESQHCQMPRFDGKIGHVVDVLGDALGHAPEWEDLVSGRGLVRTYDAMGAIAAGKPLVFTGDHAHRAGEIAEAARAGDAQALAAIGVFYCTLGRLAQVLALTLLPCAAVVIGGASTELNFGLLRDSGLAETFSEHGRFSDLLAAIPLHAVGGDVNLEGGVWLAAQAS